jgi:hypothetical protein
MKGNVLNVYQSCSPAEVLENKGWYMRAHKWCEQRAQMYNLDVRTVAAVISALSPRNKWERNLVDADQVLYAVFNGYSVAWVKSGTFMQNRLKAYDIAAYNDPSLVGNGMKTKAFINCIADPKCDDVVVDVWAMRVLTGDLEWKARGLSESEYDECAQAYRDAGKEVQLIPSEIQAVTWCAVRNRKRLKVSANQMTMF